ncbi:unnamed protein product [Adineta ricciae]|nr:unnamed protein product [Adineta ricciae]
MIHSTTSDTYINTEKAIAHRRVGIYSFQLKEEIVYSIVPIKNACTESPSTNVCAFTSNPAYPNIVEISTILPSRDKDNALPRYDTNHIFSSIRSNLQKMLQLHQSLEQIAKQDFITHLVGEQFHGIEHIQKSLQYLTSTQIENGKPNIFQISSTTLVNVFKQINNNKITFDFLTDIELRSFLLATISMIDNSYQIIDLSESLKLFTDLIIGQSIYILRSCGDINKQSISSQSCLIVATSFFRPLVENDNVPLVYQLTPLPAILNREQFIYSNIPRIVALNTQDQSVMTWNTIPNKNECLFSIFLYCSKRPPLIRLSQLPCLSQLLYDDKKSVSSCDITRILDVETKLINIVDDVWLFSHDGPPMYCQLQPNIEPYSAFTIINESSLLRLPCEQTMTCSDIKMLSSNCIDRKVLIKSSTTDEYEFLSTTPFSLQNMNIQLLSTYQFRVKTSFKNILDNLNNDRLTVKTVFKEFGVIVLSAFLFLFFSIVLFVVRYVKRLLVRRLEHLETNVDDLVHAVAIRLDDESFA